MKKTEKSTVTKKHLASKLASEYGMPSSKCKEYIDYLFTTITASLCGGEEVYIDRFGTFRIHTRDITIKAPKMEKAVQIKDYKSPKFKPSKGLKESVKAS